MLKRSMAFTALILIASGILFTPVYAEMEQGYPYDDNVKYSYFTKLEEGFDDQAYRYDPSLKLPEDAYYRYHIRVRDAKNYNRILSEDKLELLFKGLPPLAGTTSKTTQYNIPITPIIKDGQPALIRKDIEIKHYHSINFELTGSQLTWTEFVAEQRSRQRTKMGDTEIISFSDSSYMGYKALVMDVKNTNYSRETGTYLSAIDRQVIYIYIEDAKIPKGIVILEVGTTISALGEYFVFNSFPYNNFTEKQFNQYASEMKDAVRKQLSVERDNRDSVLKNISAIRPQITKTVDMTVPYTGPAVTNPVKNVEIDTNASATAGEVAVSIPAVIAIGVLSAAAAIGAAGVAGGSDSTSGDNTDSEQQSAFNMVISKNFGDAIKHGEKYQVSARITELKQGVVVERPDLTEQISIFSNEIVVGAVFMNGINMATEVQIQETAPPQGVVSFHYNGPLAYFQNNVRFRLLGKGQIKLATDNLNILSTDSKPFELIYELVNFAEKEPPLEVTASSGYVKLDMGKNDKDQTILLISPGSDAQEWDHSSFTKVCSCEISVLDGKLPIRASFEVTVCFEGIGTAYEHLKINENEKDSLIECYTDSEREKRKQNALWLPLTVMCWNAKNRILEPDTAKAGNLRFDYKVDPAFEFHTPESKQLAEKVVTGAKLSAALQAAPNTLRIDTTKKPSTYRVMTSADPGEGAAPFDINIVILCESDSALTPLVLKAQLKPNPDFKGMVQWFLEYPLGGSAGNHITLGNVQTYHAALDFIENRVYPISGVPWAANLTWLASKSSHYEPGDGNPLRKSYIAIEDGNFPKGIGLANFKPIQTLVHELTHVIEHQNGDIDVSIHSERHAYYLQYLSDLSRHLTDMENPSCNVKAEVQWAIQAFYQMYTDPEITSDLSRLNTWFGAKFDLSAHQLFDMYAYHIDVLGSNIPPAHADAIAEQFRRLYFPGDLYGLGLAPVGKALGYYIETDGPFKGAQWEFNWNQATLISVKLTHTDYTFDIGDYRWVGGNEMKLKIQAVLNEKKSKAKPDNMLIVVDCGTYSTDSKFFPYVRSFQTNWKTLHQSYNSILYANTGLTESTSWAEKKK